MPQALSINSKVNEVNGIVSCGRELCGRDIGVLRYDNVFVILQSFRFCDLEYVSSVNEHTPSSYTSLVVNRLIELNDQSVNFQPDLLFEPEVLLQEGYVALDNSIGIDYNFGGYEMPMPEGVAEFIIGNDVLLPNNGAVQSGYSGSVSSQDANSVSSDDAVGVSSIDGLDGSPASSDILETLVREILDEDDEFNGLWGDLSLEVLSGPFYEFLPPDDGELLWL